MDSALDRLNDIHTMLTDSYLSSEKSMEDNTRDNMREEFRRHCIETEAYSFSVSTRDFPRPLRASFILRRMTEVLSAFLHDKLLLSDICIAIDEVVSNILDHSYDDNNDAYVLFRFTLYRQRIQIEVEDFGEKGKNFDFGQVGQYGSRNELIQATREKGRGMGVYLIRKIMNHVQYQVIPGECNKITMVKNFEQQGEKPAS